MRRILLLLVVLGLAPLGVAAAQDTGSRIDVVVVDGPMDHRTVAFIRDAITGTDADVVVLQLNVAVVLGGDLEGLRTLIADPPVPVAVWVGPAPATARGAAVSLVAAAALRGAAPGATIGMASPAIAGGPAVTDGPAGLGSELVKVTEAIPGVIEMIEPSIGQFVVGLHGQTVMVAGTAVTLDTARSEIVDGVERLAPSAGVRFVSPGLVDRVLHAAVKPEAAFFFLLAGLTFAAFEFYAAGPGLAAAVAAVCLLLSGYGMAVLPMWWPGLAASLLGMLLYLIDFQRNDLGWRSLIGTGLLLFGGLRFTDGAPQLVPSWWVVVLVVLGTAAFFLFALTTVVRARFSTQTIGREHLIGRHGVATAPFGPDGEVEVGGSRWRARSSRRSVIVAGDEVVVVRIDGVVLEVDPV